MILLKGSAEVSSLGAIMSAEGLVCAVNCPGDKGLSGGFLELSRA